MKTSDANVSIYFIFQSHQAHIYVYIYERKLILSFAVYHEELKLEKPVDLSLQVLRTATPEQIILWVRQIVLSLKA